MIGLLVKAIWACSHMWHVLLSLILFLHGVGFLHCLWSWWVCWWHILHVLSCYGIVLVWSWYVPCWFLVPVCILWNRSDLFPGHTLLKRDWTQFQFVKLILSFGFVQQSANVFSSRFWFSCDDHFALQSMEWRVPDQEVDQRKLGERLQKKTVRHVD